MALDTVALRAALGASLDVIGAVERSVFVIEHHAACAALRVIVAELATALDPAAPPLADGAFPLHAVGALEVAVADIEHVAGALKRRDLAAAARTAASRAGRALGIDIHARKVARARAPRKLAR